MFLAQKTCFETRRYACVVRHSPFSVRPLSIPHRVDAATKHARSQRLLALSEQKRRAFYARFVGTSRPVLWEHAREGEPLQGFTDNYLRCVQPEGVAVADNTISTVTLSGLAENGECLTTQA